MVKKSKENVEIIAQKIFLELHLGKFKGDLNVHDLFKKKDIRDKFTADEIYEIDKALLFFCIFSFIPFTIVILISWFIC